MFKKAKWIWVSNCQSPNTYGEFYGEFCTQGKAKIKISCDGDYTLFINGKYASSNQYGDFEHYKSVDILDISPFVKEGNNSLAILVWHFGKDTQRYKKYAPGVIFEVSDGNKILLSSSETVLSRKSKAYVSETQKEISSQLGFSYVYNSTAEDRWLIGKGDGFAPSILAYKNCNFVLRPNKKLVLGEKVKGKLMSKSPYVYDLGKEYVGLLSFDIFCKSEANIQISYGECLKNGQVKKEIHNRNFNIDYIAKEGENSYTNYMLRFACRYLQVECDKEIHVRNISIIPQYYPAKPRESNLKGIDLEIYNICLNTLNLCMMEHYVDCPWREQCLYAFDSRNQMLSGYFAYEKGNVEYAKSNLILMSKDRRDDGLLSICYPCGIDLTIPSFSLHYITSVKEYIEFSKDVSIIKEVGEKIKEIINTFLNTKKVLNTKKDGLVCKFTKKCHWNFYDWSEGASGSLYNVDNSAPDAYINLFFLIALLNYKKICELCTLPFDFNKEIDSLKSNIKSAFYQKGSGLFVTEKSGKPTSLVNALALCAEIVTGEEAKFICKKLLNNSLIPCSLSMKCFIYDGLIKTDKEMYKQYIIEDIRKTYAPMIETGTVWETAIGESDFDNAGSLCHGWSSIPIYYYNILQDKG